MTTRDWLWRAYRHGARFAPTPAVTVLVVSATTRSNVYSPRQFREHAAIAKAMREEPDVREQRLVRAWQNPRPTHLRAYRARDLWRALGMRTIGRVAVSLGIDPEPVYCYHRFPRKWGFLPRRGGVIAELYRRRGLAKPP